MQLFSMGSELSRSGEPGSCSQICNWNFHKDQQHSTTEKLQPADFRRHSLYARKIAHLIPNQIPLPRACFKNTS